MVDSWRMNVQGDLASPCLEGWSFQLCMTFAWERRGARDWAWSCDQWSSWSWLLVKPNQNWKVQRASWLLSILMFRECGTPWFQCHRTPAQEWDRKGIRTNPIKSYLCSFVFFTVKQQLQAIDPLETRIQRIAGQKHFQTPNHSLTKKAHFSSRLP